MITHCDKYHECNKQGGELEKTGKPLCIHRVYTENVAMERAERM